MLFKILITQKSIDDLRENYAIKYVLLMYAKKRNDFKMTKSNIKKNDVSSKIDEKIDEKTSKKTNSKIVVINNILHVCENNKNVVLNVDDMTTTQRETYRDYLLNKLRHETIRANKCRIRNTLRKKCQHYGALRTRSYVDKTTMIRHDVSHDATTIK